MGDAVSTRFVMNQAGGGDIPYCYPGNLRVFCHHIMDNDHLVNLCPENQTKYENTLLTVPLLRSVKVDAPFPPQYQLSTSSTELPLDPQIMQSLWTMH